MGLGAVASPASKLAVLHRGRPKKAGGNLAVIAAGTGLGEATFIWDGAEHIACATEGSHVDFAPRNEVEDALLVSLRKEHGRVSYERIASGSTLSRVYDFFVRERRVKETKAAAASLAAAEDRNAAVVDLAESGRSEKTPRRAPSISGRASPARRGTYSLKCPFATAWGSYVCRRLGAARGGGPRERACRDGGRRGRARSWAGGGEGPSLDKGRMRPLLEAIPVAVCLESRKRASSAP
ncbi:MAG: glucokinase [Labilithrix sp.]|nr:glucokinase [Labilithrix sp.]